MLLLVPILSTLVHFFGLYSFEKGLLWSIYFIFIYVLRDQNNHFLEVQGSKLEV